MRLLIIGNRWAPPRWAGAEMYVRELGARLVARGHTVRALVQSAPAPGDPDMLDSRGVSVVYRVGVADWPLEARRFCPDAVVVHLELGPKAARWARAQGLPVVVLLHCHISIALHREGGLLRGPGESPLFVANTHVLARELPSNTPHVVLHPPLDFARLQAAIHAPPRGAEGWIGMVNVFGPKGGDLFADLARTMGERRFLAVPGGYGRQEAMPSTVEWAPPGEDVGAQFARMRLLCMPSRAESFGMAAVEAQACGVPVLASDLPGLRESLGDGAVFLPPPDHPGALAAWQAAVRAMDDEVLYTSLATAARANAARYAGAEAEAELDGFVAAIETRLAGAPP